MKSNSEQGLFSLTGEGLDFFQREHTVIGRNH